ncbi:unnamed protein product [Lampetra planeri]
MSNVLFQVLVASSGSEFKKLPAHGAKLLDIISNKNFLQKRRLLEIPKRRRPPYILKRDYGTWNPKRPYILRRDAGGVGTSDEEGPEARGSQECQEWHQKGYDLMKTLCKWRGF